jgi:putative transcriptional regulator
MITHHPTQVLLQQFVAGDLPVSVSVAVAMHVELCSHCQQKVDALNAEQAEHRLSDTVITTDQLGDEFSDMLADITADDSLDIVRQHARSRIQIDQRSVLMPRALAQVEFGQWQRVGKLARSRMDIDDGELRSSMLQIDAGGQVPHHTHNGFGITVMLDGSFSDEFGSYERGDFIWLDQEHTHHPESAEGCLCYTVVSDALHFSQGMSRLLNPIGKLIY